MKIKIYQKDTYPEEIIQIRERLKGFPEETTKELKNIDCLRSYLENQAWTPSDHVGQLFEDLTEALTNHEIVVYHNTRLMHPKEICCEGLIFSDERYLAKQKRAVLEAGMGRGVADELEELLNKEQEFRRRDHQNRINEVCYFYDMSHYQDYEIYLATLGGEFVDNALSRRDARSHITDFLEQRIKKLGVPCVVEFWFPGKWLIKPYLYEVANHMIEKWIYDCLRKEEGDFQYHGRIEREIPANQIIAVHRYCQGSFAHLSYLVMFL
ncbi:MAG: hypothetical protein GX905_06270, partial [Bacteroidales bacterium]|nr:hypothetical protein [Bacteroidales bacterium]